MNDYITDKGEIHWDRAEPFVDLLGQHEHEVFSNRIDQINERRHETRTVSVQRDVADLIKTGGDVAPQNIYKEQIYQKKVAKVNKNKAKGEGKKYKKILLVKRFREDETGKKMANMLKD